MCHPRKWIALSVVFAMIVFPWLPAYSTPADAMFLDLRSNDAAAELIRERLLKQTPLQSSKQLVIDFCDLKKLKCQVTDGRGFYRSGEKVPVGVKSIRGHLDDYTSKGFNVSIEAFWGFDADDRLVDIWVWDTYDGP